MSVLGKARKPQVAHRAKAPPVERAGWERKPWNTLWGQWETCTNTTPESWGEQEPLDSVWYWGWFMETSHTSDTDRSNPAGRVGGASLSALKLTVDQVQGLQDQVKELTEQVAASRTVQVLQQEALLSVTHQRERAAERCSLLVKKYAVKAAHRHRKTKDFSQDKAWAPY